MEEVDGYDAILRCVKRLTKRCSNRGAGPSNPTAGNPPEVRFAIEHNSVSV